MEKKNFIVNFTLELLSTDADDVSITIDGKELKMSLLTQKNSYNYFHFQYELDKNILLPYKIPYSYSFDNNMDRMVILKHDTDKEIYVNDSKFIYPESVNFHNVTFYLSVNCPTNSQVLLISSSPCFWQDMKRTNQVRMNFYKNGIFKANVFISADMFSPISYKYFVTSPKRIQEQGRSHTIYIDSPIGGKFVFIYDNFIYNQKTSSHSFVLPYFTKPIYTGDIDMFTSHIQMEISKNPTPNSAYFSFFQQDSDVIVDEAILTQDYNENKEELSRNNINILDKHMLIWNFEKDYTKLAGKTIYFGYKDPDSENYIQWPKKETFDIDSISHNQNQPITKIDAVAYRNLSGEPMKRSVGIFIDLLSLPLKKDSSPCGSFESLERLVDWCKLCGLGYIHANISRINDNRLLDPALANIDLSNDPSIIQGISTLQEIRDAKIKVLEREFNIWKKEKKQIDLKFTEFKNLYGNFLLPLCPTPFSFYVQYILYKQLTKASIYAMKEGVQLVLDVNVSDIPGSLDQQIQLFAQISPYIKIVDASSVLSAISFGDVVSIFGNMTPSIQPIIDLIGTAVFIKHGFMDQYKACKECAIPPEKYEEFFQKFSILKTLANSPERLSRSQQFFQFFKQTANIAPCAILLDEASSTLYDEEEIISAGLVPCTDSHFCEPRFLSPEVFSEFHCSLPESEALSRIKKKLSSNAKCITLYLGDLLHALSLGRIAGTLINERKYHNAFIFNISVEELLERKENIKKINNFLTSFNLSTNPL